MDDVTITYEDLTKALDALGILRNDLDTGHVAYYVEGPELLFVLPCAPAEDAVRPSHLVAARKLLDEMGIASPERFDALLREGPHGFPLRPER
jgi:hypothetical protein